MSDIVYSVHRAMDALFMLINKQSTTHWNRYTSWNFHLQPIIRTSFHYIYYMLHEYSDIWDKKYYFAHPPSVSTVKQGTTHNFKSQEVR